MFSKSFMQFLISYDDNEKEEKNEIKEVEFKPAKIQHAAQVVINAIKDTY